MTWTTSWDKSSSAAASPDMCCSWALQRTSASRAVATPTAAVGLAIKQAARCRETCSAGGMAAMQALCWAW